MCCILWIVNVRVLFPANDKSNRFSGFVQYSDFQSSGLQNFLIGNISYE